MEDNDIYSRLMMTKEGKYQPSGMLDPLSFGGELVGRSKVGGPGGRLIAYAALIVTFLLFGYALAWLFFPMAVEGGDAAAYCVNASWLDRVDSAVFSWLYLNGRWGELAARLLGREAAWFYAVLQPWTLLALCCCVYRVALSKWPLPGRCRLSVLALIMLLATGLAGAAWLSFSATVNWLWPSVAFLALCLVTDHGFKDGLFDFSDRRMGAAYFLSFLCGWGNEYVAVAAGLWLVALIVVTGKKFRGRSEGFRRLGLMMCWGAGCLLLAPALLSRFRDAGESLASAGSRLAFLSTPGHSDVRLAVTWLLVLALLACLTGCRRAGARMLRSRGRALGAFCLAFALLGIVAWPGLPSCLLPLWIGLICIVAFQMGRAMRARTPLAAWRRHVILAAAGALFLGSLFPHAQLAFCARRTMEDFNRQMSYFGPDDDAFVFLRTLPPPDKGMGAWFLPDARANVFFPWGAATGGIHQETNEKIARIYGVKSFRCARSAYAP